MDSQFFRIPTKPNYYYGLTPYEAEKTANKTNTQPTTLPTPDSRFPGWAAPMDDGRLITEYRTHCSENIPAGSQFPVKEWITKNADEIMRVSRVRQGEMAGAQYNFDPSVVPPPVALVKCDAMGCAMFPTNTPNGIGTERVYDKSPHLFGTFELPKETAPRAIIGLNRVFENGRNSPRGRTFEPLRGKPVGTVEHMY